MKYNQIVIPHINVNDTEVTLIEQFFNTSDFIEKDKIVCSIETTKTAVEISSDFEGYIYYVSKTGGTLKIGEPIAFIFESLKELEDFNTNSKANTNNMKLISKKASDLMKEHDLKESDFPEFSVISYNSVISKLKNKKTKKISSEILDSYKENDILLLGDFNSCLVASEIYLENNDFNPINFISSDGQNMNGIYPAQISDLQLLRQRGLKNIFLCLSDYKQSKEILDEVESLNFNFQSCISQKSSVSNSSKIGKCALIQGLSLVGPQSIIGDFCKILNNVSIAHHCKIGNFVTIADGSHIGGNVIIEENVYIGIGVNVNRRVVVGAFSTIISGMTVTDFVKKNTVFKNDNKKTMSSMKTDE